MKEVIWLGSSRENLRRFPKRVRSVFGQALFKAQLGAKHPDAKPLKGFGGGSVLEVVEDFAGDAYRAVYTVKFEGFVYVLHTFQKKSKTGKRTLKRHMDLIKQRLKEARDLHAEFRAGGKV